MAYRVAGTYFASCTCEVGCPCNFGSPEGDDGYCSAAAVFHFKSGEIDGVDVSGTPVGLAADWPKGFLSGNGTGRLYFDPSTSADQRQALQRVLTGEAGGEAAGLGVIIPDWLEPQEATISLDTTNGTTRFQIGDIGEAVIEPIKNEAGEVTRLHASPAALGPEPQIMARGTGSRWRDPDLKQWASRGHAEQADIEWRG